MADEVLCVLTVPVDVLVLSANRTRGRHWGRWHRSREGASVAAAYALRRANDPILIEPVVVDVLVRRGRSMDDDNVIAGLKSVRDALVKRGLVPDDTPRWWLWGQVSYECGARWRQAPEVVLTVRRRGS